MQTIETTDRAQWTQLVAELGAHPQQSWEWGELKAATGPWEARRIIFKEDGVVIGVAQILLRKMPFPFNQIAYAPRGPQAASEERLPELADAAAAWVDKNTKAVSLKIDPAVTSINLSDAWRQSERVLVSKTAVIDLTPSEDELMKGIPNRKARQYIRKAARDGVVIRPGTKDDLPQVLAMYQATADADGFAIHESEFYYAALDMLGEVGQLFVAEKDGELHAFLWNATTTGTAFELWGAVSDAGKRSRANYLLKWEAIRSAKARGTRLYDLNGLLNDGISDFKLLFVKEPTIWVGSYDRPLSPLYGLMDASLELRRKVRSRKSAQEDTSERR